MLTGLPGPYQPIREAAVPNVADTKWVERRSVRLGVADLSSFGYGRPIGNPVGTSATVGPLTVRMSPVALSVSLAPTSSLPYGNTPLRQQRSWLATNFPQSSPTHRPTW